MSTTVARDARVLRWTGRLSDLAPSDRTSLLQRAVKPDSGVERVTASIVESVRSRGDKALFELGRDLDRVSLTSLEIPREKWRQALETIPPAVRGALERAARNIAAVHSASLPCTIVSEPEPGIVVTRRPDPLDRVGVYAPGGRAAYPSSVLMGAIPARVAGVREVILCVPPGSDGAPATVTLAAAAIAGVDRVFTIGGAGAIAAMAYGTETVPRVDKIVGPGNAFVTEAKRQLTGIVATDTLAGPSEVVVIADRSATSESVIAELLAQAEHDPAAVSIAIILDEELAAAIMDELPEAIAREERAGIIARAMATAGGVLLAESVDSATEFVSWFAPEHLVLALSGAEEIASRITTAGTIYIGSGCSVAFGDYLTGANHILPTGGAARGSSGVSVLDFFRWTTIQRVSSEARRRVADDVEIFASAEGLPAHGRAAAVAASAASVTAEQSPVSVRLGDNTIVSPPSPAVQRALAAVKPDSISAYPNVRGESARNALANYVGAERDSITIGCGSDEILDAAFRAFAKPGEAIAYPDPTFGMVPVFARANHLKPVPLPFARGGDIDRSGLLADDPAIIYLCSPNNPTGAVIRRETIESVLRDATGIVILDEAYAEFADSENVDLVPKFERLLVLRTLSKAFGLAGLRVGYAIGAPSLITRLNEVRPPYTVNAFAETAAIAAVGPGLGWMQERVAETQRLRKRLITALAAGGMTVLPSEANFVLIVGIDSTAAGAALERSGIRARVFQGLTGIGDAIRLTVGPWPVMEQAIAILRETTQ